jgi:exonuclease SbcD
MRFLHTSDWHVGKPLRGRSRLPEYEKALAEVLEITLAEKVQCVLISGDLFDSFTPTAEAERLVFHFFSELSRFRIKSVLISGNHDHPKRLAALSPLLKPLGILARTTPTSESNNGLVKIQDGENRVRIGVLPFINYAKLLKADELFGDQRKTLKTYSDRLTVILGNLEKYHKPDAINIILGHFFVANAKTSGSERALHAGIPYEVSPESIPGNFQYVAIGHLHRPQSIRASSPTHYAGSLLQLDFGEQGQQKQVNIIEAQPGCPATVTSIPLSTGRPLMELEGSLEDLEQFSTRVGNAYLKIHLHTAGTGQDLAQKVREIFPNAVEVHLVQPQEARQMIPQRLGKLQPEDMLREFYINRDRPSPSPAVMTMFRELYSEALDESD